MRKLRVLCVIVIALLSLSLFSCSTSAIWQSQSDDAQKIDVDSEKTNSSERYVVYVALNASGERIFASDNSTAATAYAVVGYTGLVAELVIPATYKDTSINANALPVTKVIAASSYSAYKCSRNGVAYTGDDARLANQTVVTSIVFGENVTYVGAGVCAGMVNLTTVYFDHVQAGVTATDAFLGISPTITYKSD